MPRVVKKLSRSVSEAARDPFPAAVAAAAAAKHDARAKVSPAAPAEPHRA